MEKSSALSNNSKLDIIIKNLDRLITDLNKLMRDGNDIEEWQLRLHFSYIKAFVEEVEAIREKASMNVRILTTTFLTYTIRFFEVIPKSYKKKIYDNNSCSMIFDFIELTSLRLEDNKVFIQNPYFNYDRLDDFLQESIELMQNYLDVITVTDDLRLLIKPLEQIKKEPLKLNRNSDYFQMFSFYKDKNYLMNTMRLLISAIERVYPDNRKYQYQFLSIIAAIGENLSPRTISERMIKFLSANIDVTKIVEFRNFIYHREQDLDNHLEAVILGLDINDFDEIKRELLKVKRAVNMGLKAIISISSREEIKDFYSGNWALISLKFYDDYYAQGINHLCPKLTAFLEIDNLEQSFKDNLEVMKDSMRHMSHTQSQESFELLITSMIKQIMDYCKLPGIGKFLKKIKNITSKDIAEELLTLRKPRLVDITNLCRFISTKGKILTPSKDQHFQDLQKALELLKVYLADLKDIIQNLSSDLTTVNGLELYED